MEAETGKNIVLPRIINKNNIHHGDTPHVPVPVEEIPKYFTEDVWKNCVRTVRTIGKVLRLEHEFHVIESIDDLEETVQIPLTRGTNRELRPSRSSYWDSTLQKIERQNKIAKREAYGVTAFEKGDRDTQAKIKGFPFPDSVRNPSSLGDTRVKHGGVYMVLGKLQWANCKPIIDVDRFIPIHDLKSAYDAFMLQHAIARHHVDCYKAHPGEILEIVRRPDEKRKPIFAKSQPKKHWTWQESKPRQIQKISKPGGS